MIKTIEDKIDKEIAMPELIDIQANLKAGKGQHNKFGNYNYRSCEDILSAVKPLLLKHKCILTISDDMVECGGRCYIKAYATIQNIVGAFRTVVGIAREADKQAGMSSAQITGSTSSYARKYALNGLFAIDDTKDDDATNKHGNDHDIVSTKDKAQYKAEALKMYKLVREPNDKLQAWIAQIDTYDITALTMGVVRIKNLIKEQTK